MQQFSAIVELMFFVPDRRKAAEWYSRLFDTPITQMEEPEYYFICVGGIGVWFSQEDEKVASGTAGEVAYWRVESFAEALGRAEALGAALYRGPLLREEDGLTMCQVRDPFGNLIGLVGP
jgi:predicted enzyme related to lactoylglutathione lyase